MLLLGACLDRDAIALKEMDPIYSWQVGVGFHVSPKSPWTLIIHLGTEVAMEKTRE